MRQSALSFRQAERILYGQGLKLDRKAYYNLARGKSMGTTPDDLLALVSVLEHDNWIYRTYWEFRTNDQGVITNQVLKAVFFTNEDLIHLARRFCPDWMIQMDGTFNTNKLRMPLIDILGVTNTDHSFLFAFCFVTSESAENWGFVLQCLEQTVFEGLPLPRVVIADQGLGLRSAFPLVWTHGILQFCEFHAGENIRRRLAGQRYKKEEREKIMSAVWIYLWSATVEALEQNRTNLKSLMKLAEQQYLEKHWVAKESQVIRLYTSQMPNLDCFSTQRDEGQHPMVKSVLNHQLRLDEGVRKLAEEMKLAAERLQEYEQADQADPRRLLQSNTWYIVREKVANKPLMKTLEQWNTLTTLKRLGEPLGHCNCTTVRRLGLPCYHDLEKAYDLGIPLPLTLFHSRWWYAAGVEVRAGWKPSYGVEGGNQLIGQFLQLQRPQHHIIDTTNELLSFREGLTGEKQQLLDHAHAQATRAILRDVQQREAFELTLPQGLPAPIQSTWNRYAKSHDKVSKRMMTGAEAAVKDANAAEAAEKKLQKQAQAEAEVIRVEKARQEAAIDEELLGELLGAVASDQESNHANSPIAEIVFSTPISPSHTMVPSPRPTTPETVRKRSFTVVCQTPEKPRAAPVTPVTPSTAITRETSPFASTTQEHAEIPLEIPASTAPARLDGRPRREGKNSVYKKAMAIERGPGRGGQRGQGGKA
jgi:hypothetical protein